MRQMLHIFRKDVRRHWLEILLSVLAVGVWAAVTPREWSPVWSPGTKNIPFVLPLIVMLLLWWVMIARVVQGEPLVGDRQFWVTRPYRRWSLLGAKVLFVVVFVLGPLLVAQVYLLMRAGFGFSADWIPALLWMHLGLVIVLVLPCFALAAVTENLVQFVLALVGIGLLVGGIAWAFSSPVFSMVEVVENQVEWVQLGLLIVGCTAAIACQYVRRRTLGARIILAGSALLAVVVMGLAPFAPFGALSELDYPARGAEGLQLSMMPDVRSGVKQIRLVQGADGSRYPARILVETKGVPEGEIESVDGSRITLDGANGFHWETKWMPGAGDALIVILRPRDGFVQLSVAVPAKIADRIPDGPIHVKLGVEISRFKDADTQEFQVREGDFRVQGLGICTLPKLYFAQNTLHCRSAFRTTPMLSWRYDAAKSTCAALHGDSEPSEDGVGFGENFDDDPGPAAFGLSPVQTMSPYFSEWQRKAPEVGTGVQAGASLGGRKHAFVRVRSMAGARFCPGTPLTVSRPVFVGRVRAEFDLGSATVVREKMSDEIYRIMPKAPEEETKPVPVDRR